MCENCKKKCRKTEKHTPPSAVLFLFLRFFQSFFLPPGIYIFISRLLAWLLIKNGSSEGILGVYVFLSFCTSFCSFRTQKNPFLFNMTNKIIFVMFFTIFFLIYPICWILDFFCLWKNIKKRYSKNPDG